MRLWDNFLKLFNKDYGTLELDAYIGDLVAEATTKELAIQACINLIASIITNGEFLTYEKGNEIRQDNYYLFNVEPNPNKSASKFWRDLISRLIYDNEALVLQQDGYFYVAESFTCKKFAFRDYVYKEIVIDGLSLNNDFFESDVFHFELHNEKIINIINALNKSYGKLVEASQKHYIKNGSKKGKLKVPTNYPQTDNAQEDLKKLLEKRFKTFFEAENGAVLPLTNGLDYEELDNSSSNSKGSIEGREIREFVNDILDFTAISFQIPPKLLRGEVSNNDKLIDSMLTFCIKPLAELITDEINRKLYGKKAFLERTYMKLDVSRVKAVNIKDIAGSLEILLRIGSYTVDDCLRKLGMEPLNTDWSKTHFMTKNYEEIKKRIEGR